ncbi:MerR family transcriptional regulator [Paenibacillus sp. SYP-B3998]|uniref:MerR family transcriptional regulator n=1 Tax=Paenibacillus sp. SYP-B3998 TaxID=2678564 RepID=A0A6G4A578_9BACL|nr:MerR family transcriptional regulator [Paenibacillus sp. SYP-B3998]NEW08959.1 MerR family transcriptional regulator [Paenibacillus sp. SYP-B3998]
MLYTVKDVAELAKVTIKTLYHYQKIGLLLPCKVSEAGYRLYGVAELERLQQILFYRELDFSLEEIKPLLEDGNNRGGILAAQKELLLVRKLRLELLIQTIDISMNCETKGEKMKPTDMFQGFQNEDEWKSALAEQDDYLKKTYNYDLIDSSPIEAKEMNESALEALHFMNGVADALRTGKKVNSAEVQTLIQTHIAFLNAHGHEVNRASFAAQTRFFLQDDFHCSMLESQQIGLAYYLCLAAESHLQTT